MKIENCIIKNMKAVILAGGFGTRGREDIQ